MSAPAIEPLVEVTRGGRVESIHHGAAAVVDTRGRLVAHVGDPGLVTFLRSTAKPFQLLPLLEGEPAAGGPSGADRFGFSPVHLAVMAASHSGEPRHIEAVQDILDRIGLTAEALLCGAHEPLSAEAQRILRESHRRPAPIDNNCSGKHAGMLAQCVARGLTTHDYLDPQHPVQVTIRDRLAELSDTPVDAVGIGVDGCSAPCFALSLHACALAFARLADPSAVREPSRSALRRVAQAMTAHPEMVGGEGRLDTDLMRAAGGRVISKGGAEGYHGVGIPDRGLGAAVKIMDGMGARADGATVVEVLRQLGALDAAALAQLRPHHHPIVTTHRGLAVGEVRAVFRLAFV